MNKLQADEFRSNLERRLKDRMEVFIHEQMTPTTLQKMTRAAQAVMDEALHELDLSYNVEVVVEVDSITRSAKLKFRGPRHLEEFIRGQRDDHRPTFEDRLPASPPDPTPEELEAIIKRNYEMEWAGIQATIKKMNEPSVIDDVVKGLHALAIEGEVLAKNVYRLTHDVEFEVDAATRRGYLKSGAANDIKGALQRLREAIPEKFK